MTLLVNYLQALKRFRRIVSSNSGKAASLFMISCFLPTGSVLGDDEVFEILEISSEGRAVNARFADIDGDGRRDLIVASLNGMPPNESRTLRVHLQHIDGSYSEPPSHVVTIPKRSAVFDVADLKESPGEELVFLRPDAITIMSIANGNATEWNIPIEGPSTIAASDDERGFDQHTLVYDVGPETLLLIPQIGVVSVLAANGEQMGQIEVGGRANYFVARSSSIFSAESDLQLYLDTAKLSIGDVNGDSRVDIVAATRHEIRVFLRREDGSFDSKPSYAHALNLISPLDHSRGSGSVVTMARDVDNNGLLDLVVTHVKGTFSDTVTTTYFYRNQNGRWDLDNPDETFVNDGSFSSDLLLDINGDDAYELIRLQFKFSVLEMVEILLTRKIDSVVEVHRLDSDGRFETKPSSRRKFSTGISFDTFRPKGFMPQAGVDINADGFLDVVTSADGKGIEIYLGTEDELFTRRTARQDMPTAGRIFFEDFNDDGLPDFVLYDPQSFDAQLLVGRNLNVLPRDRVNSD